MGSSEELKAILEERLGYFPAFLLPALPYPEQLQELGRHTLSSYVDNPIPGLFKERLFACLSCYRRVPYCTAVHACGLREMGVPAAEILAVLQIPQSLAVVDVEATAAALSGVSAQAGVWPRDRQIEDAVFQCAVFVFLGSGHSLQLCQKLRELLGEHLYGHLVALLAYLKAYHFWVETHPEISYADDARIMSHLSQLLADEPALSAMLLPAEDGRAPMPVLPAAPLPALSQLQEELRKSQTEVAATKRQLQDTRQLLDDFLNHHPGLAFVKDDQGRYVYVSDNFLKFFHRTREEILGKTDFEWLPHSVARQFTDNDRLVRMTGKPLEVIESVPQSQGVIHSLVNKFPIRDSSGRILLGGTAIDITQRLAAEAELKESQERLKLALEASRTGTWDWDIVADKVVWDENLHRMFGLAPGSFAGTSQAFLALVHPQDRAAVEKTLEAALSGQAEYSPEFRVIWRDGSIHHLAARSRVFCNMSGKAVRIAGVCLDVTDRKLVEQQSRELSALKQREELMVSLTQDLMDPVMGADRLLGALAGDKLQLGSLSADQTQLVRRLRSSHKALMSQLQNLMEVSRYKGKGQRLHFEPVDLRQLIESCLADAAVVAAERALELRSLLPQRPVKILADPVSIRCLLRNLLDNALNFTPSGGSVSVTLSRLKDKVCVAVEDNGCGMPPHAQSLLFKRPALAGHAHGDRPAGLGLFVCRQIVEAHRGTIECVSELGRGTRMTVTLWAKPLSQI
ncbi:MAG TPA: PAS domain-containing protein [Candidatus Obscuribacterales bacterium]